MRGSVVHQDARYERISESRTEVESFVLVARKNTHKNHHTSFRTKVESIVHRDARYARNHEYPKGLNNVPCVVRSCNKLHATWNYARDVSVVQQNARDNMEKRAVGQM